MVSGNEEDQHGARYRVQNIRSMMIDLREHLKEDIIRVDDPRTLVLFEVSAEVLKGLIAAYEHYELGQEKAWK